MTIEFATLGSCSSRNIFYSKLNADYKKYFKINKSLEFVNMVSLMSDPIEFDETLINSNNKYNDDYIKEDLNKKYLDFLKEDENIEYLIIDTFFDAEFNNLIVGKNQYLTESTRFKDTAFYDSVKDCERISIQENFDEYFDLWKDSYKRFFEFIHTNCPNFKIVLNCSRSVYKYLKDGNIAIHRGFKIRARDNKYRNILDTHILENYDVDVLPFDETTLTDINHIFGRHPTHYETRYYTDKTYQLNEIIKRNSSLGIDDELNRDIRQLLRNNQILAMRSSSITYEQNEEIDDLNKKINELNRDVAKLTRNKDYLESEIDAMKNSNSWKMTEPLRKMKRKM